MHGNAHAAQALLAAGAAARHRNAAGLDALTCAARYGHLPLLPLLLPQAGRDGIPDALLAATAAGHVKASPAEAVVARLLSCSSL
mmetsp:Transcript_19386/g.65381  ORF Transcript_19386/g.65381 Transcript_19386/m.65381 type:complete len:85 (-) Transcript_19386:219-473(-)